MKPSEILEFLYRLDSPDNRMTGNYKIIFALHELLLYLKEKETNEPE